MGIKNIKSFIAVFILVAYISISIFGLFQFSHRSEMAMTDCPYAQGGFSVCDSNLEHINHWHQFSNIPLSKFIFLLLIFGVTLLFLGSKDIFNTHFYKWKYYLNTKRSTYLEIITKWLSLFEHSPPVLPSYHL